MSPLFKYRELQFQYYARPELLKEICALFCKLSGDMGITPVVTRVTDPIECSPGQPCESGVHPAGRGVDFRDEYLGKRLYTDVQADTIVSTLNEAYPRKDGKPTALHHRFAGTGALHIHLQSPWDDKNGLKTS